MRGPGLLERWTARKAVLSEPSPSSIAKPASRRIAHCQACALTSSKESSTSACILALRSNSEAWTASIASHAAFLMSFTPSPLLGMKIDVTGIRVLREGDAGDLRVHHDGAADQDHRIERRGRLGGLVLDLLVGRKTSRLVARVAELEMQFVGLGIAE